MFYSSTKVFQGHTSKSTVYRLIVVATMSEGIISGDVVTVDNQQGFDYSGDYYNNN
jgi:phosphohistidine swiveling domain-containing protein